MLTLAQASSFFDRTPIKDADNGNLLFYGQVDPYDESKRDSGAAYRRILSVAAGTVMPASRTVSVFGQALILGNQEVDGLDTIHRVKYTLQPCTAKVGVSRLAGFVTGTPASNAWAALEWVKDSKEMGTSSDVARIYNVFLPAGLNVRAQDVLTQAGQAYLVLAARELPSGFLAAEAVQLDYALATAAITARVYDARAGTFAAGVLTHAPCARVRWQNLFNNRSEAYAHYKDGDDTLVFPAGTGLNTAALVNLAGNLWHVVSVDSLGGAVTAHARPAWA